MRNLIIIISLIFIIFGCEEENDPIRMKISNEIKDSVFVTVDSTDFVVHAEEIIEDDLIAFGNHRAVFRLNMLDTIGVIEKFGVGKNKTAWLTITYNAIGEITVYHMIEED